MKKIVFDTETRNFFHDVGSNDPAALDLSIICLYDYETGTYHSFLQEELPNLWPLLERTEMLIGFNSDHFDIPLLNKYYSGNLEKIKSLDILKEIRKVSGRRMSLNQVAEATIGIKKLGKGVQAVHWWNKGDIENLRNYCLEDVKITKEIYDYARAHNLLKYQEGGVVKEVRLDASKWEEESDSGLTFSLPF